jgi:heterotetrameric sarcosine oxidase gamma subunit
MKLAMIGLGRMGGNMVKRLEEDGHELATYARSGGGTADSLEELVGQLEAPRVVWMMIPAGPPTESVFSELLDLLEAGDVIVDGGNSNFRDSQRRAAVAGERAAHWLGPDEWLLLAPEAEGPGVARELGAALAGLPHSLVGVGHRNTALTLSGPEAATVLNAGCPLDLDLAAFPVGACTRTVFGKAEIVLWRAAERTFHIEVWRSFAAYVWQLIEEARRELAGQGAPQELAGAPHDQRVRPVQDRDRPVVLAHGGADARGGRVREVADG